MKITKFGVITENAAGHLHFEAFDIDCEGQSELKTQAEIVLTAVIERLQRELAEFNSARFGAEYPIVPFYASDSRSSRRSQARLRAEGAQGAARLLQRVRGPSLLRRACGAYGRWSEVVGL
jgi:hypothetical protein